MRASQTQNGIASILQSFASKVAASLPVLAWVSQEMPSP